MSIEQFLINVTIIYQFNYYYQIILYEHADIQKIKVM